MSSTDPIWTHIVGGVGGTFAVIWTLWRSFRERERVHVKYYVYAKNHPIHVGPVAQFEVVNLGTHQTQITRVERAKKPQWTYRWPFRLVSFRTRDRWFFRSVLFSRAQGWVQRVKSFDPRILTARERVIDTIDAEIERWVKERQWLVVETALRPYTARIRDHRGKAAWAIDEDKVP